MWKIYEIPTGNVIKDGFITLNEANDWSDDNIPRGVTCSFVEYDENGDMWAWNWGEIANDERAV